MRQAKNNSWKRFTSEIQQELTELTSIIESAGEGSSQKAFILKELEILKKTYEPIRKDLLNTARKVLRLMFKEQSQKKRYACRMDSKNY